MVVFPDALRGARWMLGDVLRRFVSMRTAIVGATFLALAAAGYSDGGRREGIPNAAITTTAPLRELAADGTTVAAEVPSPKTACGEQILIWDVRRETPVVMHAKCPTYYGTGYYGNDDLSLAVGGGMVGVLRLASFDDDHVIASVLTVARIPTSLRWTAITAVYDYEYSAGEGDYLSVLGDGPMLAFNKWTVCYVFDPQSDTCPGVSTDGQSWVSNGRLVEVRPPGSKGAQLCPRPSGEPYPDVVPWGARVKACRRIGSGARLVGAVALDRGRFLVLPPKGRVTIVEAGDGSATELPIPTSTVREAELDGSDLSILRKESPGIFALDVRDASTGVLRQTWRLSPAPVKGSSVHLEDAHAGIVVYRVGTTIHLRRVADRKSYEIVIPDDQGPVHARLEDPGLVYSLRLPGTKPRGRIEFVPLRQLLGKLR